MKWCKFCNRYRDEDFDFCPRCGRQLVNRVVVTFHAPEYLSDGSFLHEVTDLNDVQIQNLIGYMSTKSIDVEFVENRVESVEFL